MSINKHVGGEIGIEVAKQSILAKEPFYSFKLLLALVRPSELLALPSQLAEVGRLDRQARDKLCAGLKDTKEGHQFPLRFRMRCLPQEPGPLQDLV